MGEPSCALDTRTAPTWASGSPPDRWPVTICSTTPSSGSPEGAVEVVCSCGTLVVRDHGPGVEDSDVPFIFDRFYRVPSARMKPGSGVGLAIVAQVARDEGGSVYVNRADEGGAVRFSPPQPAARSRAMKTTEPCREAVPSAGMQKTLGWRGCPSTWDR